MNINIRTGDGISKINVNDSLIVDDIIPIIANKTGHPENQTKHLVVSPNKNKTGSIIPRKVTLNKAMFNSKEDILELWCNPNLISINLYFEQSGCGMIRQKAITQLDFGTPLVYMIPTIIRILELSPEQEFIIQYCKNIDNLNERKKWLHTGLSLEEHGILPESCLLCFPVNKMLKKADICNNSFNSSNSYCGWLLKRSIKKDHSSAKQKRYFIFSNGILFYYRKEKESTAAGAIALEYYAISRRIQPKKKKYALLLSLSVNCFNNLTRVYKLQAENEQELEKWYSAIENGCINKKSNRVFGVDIKKVVQRKENQSKSVPNIVRDCIQYLRKNGLDKEGLFRLSASASDIEHYKNEYNNGISVIFPNNIDHNIPAALLKCYLRELPDPLFPFSSFHKLLSIDISDKDKAIEPLSVIIANFPIENYGTLKMIISFMNELLNYVSSSKMSAQNLATVLGPNIIRSRNESEDIQYFANINGITELLILKHDIIFNAVESKDISKKVCKAATGEIKPIFRGRGGVRSRPGRGNVRGNRGRVRKSQPNMNTPIRRSSTSSPSKTVPGSPLLVRPNQASKPPPLSKVPSASSIHLSNTNRPLISPRYSCSDNTTSIIAPKSQIKQDINPEIKKEVIDEHKKKFVRKTSDPPQRKTKESDNSNSVTINSLHELIEIEKNKRISLSKQIEEIEKRIIILENKKDKR